jgi:hypothetical protein
MLSLFQQFLASMGNKIDNGNSHTHEASVEKAEHTNEGEKAKMQLEGQGKEIAESLAQGEARGLALNSGSYCYRCLTRGHPKEECPVNLFCEICESSAHVKRPVSLT